VCQHQAVERVDDDVEVAVDVRPSLISA
jgi:hypothetical protein